LKNISSADFIAKDLKRNFSADFIKKISTADFIEKHFYSWFVGRLAKKKSVNNFSACKLQSLHIGDFPKAVGGLFLKAFKTTTKKSPASYRPDCVFF
jgi:hypothetical protein